MVRARFLLPAAWMAGVLVLPAPRALAGPADLRSSSVEAVLVGNPSGSGYGSHSPGAMAAPGFLVIVRDVNNAPERGESVTLHFGGTDVRLHTSQQSGVSVNCAGRTLTGTTDSNGSITFFPRFGGFANDAAVSVDAEGFTLAPVRARSTDLDAIEGRTGAGDLARFASILLKDPEGPPEADFDVSGGGGSTWRISRSSLPNCWAAPRASLAPDGSPEMAGFGTARDFMGVT